MSLNKKLKELEEKFNEDEEMTEEEMEEGNTTAAVPGYNTPYAFGKKKDKDIEVLGYKKVKESKFMKLAKATLMNEVSYKEYKKDESATQKQKVNRAVKEINSRLYKIESIISQNIKLKTEAGIDSNKYWKSTRSNLQKISEKMQRISERLRKF